MMEKEKALEIALSKIEKDFGKGAIMKLGDAAANISVSTIPSGCLQLDYALGVGGLPRGRIIEIRARILRQDYPGAACHSGGSEARRYSGIHRRRTRAGSGIRPQSRR